MLTGNKAVSIEGRFFNKYEGYSFPEYEKDVYHVVSMIQEFDQRTGNPVQEPQVQKYTQRMFEYMMKNRGFESRATYILHDPTVKGGDVLGNEEPKKKGRKPKVGEAITTITGEEIKVAFTTEEVIN